MEELITKCKNSKVLQIWILVGIAFGSYVLHLISDNSEQINSLNQRTNQAIIKLEQEFSDINGQLKFLVAAVKENLENSRIKQRSN